ncbi:MAG: NAD(P)/FAD-dependent oxidoreductase [Desulfobulbaceae bacterium]|uniref:NAD(P)/FAD-dependent oxidoreductase n=1 Tax=Candidatus Desulfobia pelagia TaxID=2841692 RepID=A0A8J6TC71_9BACT|nr:NAD(P)/FAD-dependent oxidoreductase [Candidatus Desulfobia pelagia]
MTQRRVIIIGAGPAGLMAAGRSALAGAETLILEKMKQPGRKLGITGKGRCNITNSTDVTDFIAHFGNTGPFLRQAFFRFFNTDLISFLEDLGQELVTERGGRVFPASGKATDIVKALEKWALQCGAQFQFSSPVDTLIIKDGHIGGVVCKGKELSADAVILATGGASYPLTGSTGDGYQLAESTGHRIVPIRPALVPLVTAGNIAGKMKELNLRNIKVRMFVDGKKHKEAFGELTFTAFGLSGPVVLTLSRDAVDALDLGKQVEFSLDLKPALDEKKLDARLIRDISSRGKEEMNSLLRGLMPGEMVPVCLELTQIPHDRKACELSAKERRQLRTWLKDFRLEVTRPRPIAEAIVTAGGIDTREIHPKTMESKLTQGLFIAGELLDIQADTGGYNLQAAFSTGWIAGNAAALG